MHPERSKIPDQSENAIDGLIVAGTLHSDKRGNFGLIHDGKIGHICHLLGSLNRHGDLLHADTDADVHYCQPICHSSLKGYRLVT